MSDSLKSIKNKLRSTKNTNQGHGPAFQPKAFSCHRPDYKPGNAHDKPADIGLSRSEVDEIGGNDQFLTHRGVFYSDFYLQNTRHGDCFRQGDAGALGVAAGFYFPADSIYRAGFDEDMNF